MKSQMNGQKDGWNFEEQHSRQQNVVAVPITAVFNKLGHFWAYGLQLSEFHVSMAIDKNSGS